MYIYKLGSCDVMQFLYNSYQVHVVFEDGLARVGKAQPILHSEGRALHVCLDSIVEHDRKGLKEFLESWVDGHEIEFL